MNISKTVTKTLSFGTGCCGAAIVILSAATGVAQAATVPGVISAPAGVGVQSVGGVVNAVAQGHAGIAPTVYNTSPTLEPLADGVTSGLQSVGAGITAVGQRAQSGGLAVNPVAGARTGLQTLRDGSLVQVRAGSLALGKGSPTTIVGVGALSNAPPQGTLATAGVANANALLNANVAPQ